jgi:hypothetical protein
MGFRHTDGSGYSVFHGLRRGVTATVALRVAKMTGNAPAGFVTVPAARVGQDWTTVTAEVDNSGLCVDTPWSFTPRAARRLWSSCPETDVQALGPVPEAG